MLQSIIDNPALAQEGAAQMQWYTRAKPAFCPFNNLILP